MKLSQHPDTVSGWLRRNTSLILNQIPGEQENKKGKNEALWIIRNIISVSYLNPSLELVVCGSFFATRNSLDTTRSYCARNK